jgi:hypothetical protein
VPRVLFCVSLSSLALKRPLSINQLAVLAIAILIVVGTLIIGVGSQKTAVHMMLSDYSSVQLVIAGPGIISCINVLCILAPLAVNRCYAAAWISD